MKPRNASSYDQKTNLITITNPKGEIVLQRLARTPEMALAEFKYATDCWFACMDKETRQEALEYALEAILRVEFKPNVAPK